MVNSKRVSRCPWESRWTEDLDSLHENMSVSQHESHTVKVSNVTWPACESAQNSQHETSRRVVRS